LGPRFQDRDSINPARNNYMHLKMQAEDPWPPGDDQDRSPAATGNTSASFGADSHAEDGVSFMVSGLSGERQDIHQNKRRAGIL
jgi:hypothetical protein